MTISIRRLTLALWIGWAVLLALSLVTHQLSTDANAFYHVRAAVAARFDHDGEASLPAWYQASALLVCALVAAAIAMRSRAMRLPASGRWAVLAAVFVYCSCDETAVLHETFGRTLSHHLGRLGFGVYSWIVVGIPVVVALVVAYWPLLSRLSPPIRNTLLLAGVCYVTGAIGFEVIEARFDALWGSMSFSLIAAVEETLEMAGIILFLAGALAYARDISAFEVIRVESTPGAPRPDASVIPLPDSRRSA